MKSNDYKYDDIHKGMSFAFKKMISEKDVMDFAKLTGDYNPLHCDEDYAKKSTMGSRIAHGMLLSSLFSTLLGMHCPGKRNLYLTQNLNFHNPLKLNEMVTVQGEILNKTDSLKMLEIKTTILDQNGKIIVDGIAKVKVLE
ncbi:MAG: MaoC family dehydratase [Nanoarchaeota archaeon]